MEITRDVNGKAKRDNDDTPSLPFNFEKRPIIHFGLSQMLKREYFSQFLKY